jgi:hypothetical protein
MPSPPPGQGHETARPGVQFEFDVSEGRSPALSGPDVEASAGPVSLDPLVPGAAESDEQPTTSSTAEASTSSRDMSPPPVHRKGSTARVADAADARPARTNSHRFAHVRGGDIARLIIETRTISDTCDGGSSPMEATDPTPTRGRAVRSSRDSGHSRERARMEGAAGPEECSTWSRPDLDGAP